MWWELSKAEKDKSWAWDMSNRIYEYVWRRWNRLETSLSKN